MQEPRIERNESWIKKRTSLNGNELEIEIIAVRDHER
jgi:hypothetical protein